MKGTFRWTPGGMIGSPTGLPNWGIIACSASSTTKAERMRAKPPRTMINPSKIWDRLIIFLPLLLYLLYLKQGQNARGLFVRDYFPAHLRKDLVHRFEIDSLLGDFRGLLIFFENGIKLGGLTAGLIHPFNGIASRLLNTSRGIAL